MKKMEKHEWQFSLTPLTVVGIKEEYGEVWNM